MSCRCHAIAVRERYAQKVIMNSLSAKAFLNQVVPEKHCA